MGMVGWYIFVLLLADPVYSQINLFNPNPQQAPYFPNQQPVLPYNSYYGGDTFKQIDPYLVKQYRSAHDFFASSRQELDRKVQDASDLLTEIRRNMNELVYDARSRGDTYLQQSLYRVDAASQDVLNFQRQLSMDRQTPFQQLEADWENRVTALFDNGLYPVVRAADIALGGASTPYMGLIQWVLALAVMIIFP